MRLGQSLRALRRRNGILQVDLAHDAGVSDKVISRIEAGQVTGLRVATLRAVFEAVGARLFLNAWWNGAALDRLLDERHAALVERCVNVLRGYGWRTEVEVTFSVYGERGSIDVLGGHDDTRCGLVIEVKGSIGSIEETNRTFEETNRTFDLKVRHGQTLAAERFGWRPTSVSRMLVVPEDSTVRRVVAAHAATLESAYPARGRDVRRWLRAPGRAIRGIWFLSEPQPTVGRSVPGSPRRPPTSVRPSRRVGRSPACCSIDRTVRLRPGTNGLPPRI
jgi:transcriptional regulator with XRE-family HTH domain